jgi:hypothetical protein
LDSAVRRNVGIRGNFVVSGGGKPPANLKLHVNPELSIRGVPTCLVHEGENGKYTIAVTVNSFFGFSVLVLISVVLGSQLLLLPGSSRKYD